MWKTPVILDGDPGHDDAIALVVALASDALELKAVTAVCGNAAVDKTTTNALKILEMCGRGDIPVASGASKPLLAPFRPGKTVHGESGMDGPQLPAPRAKKSDLRAVELMAKVLKESEVPVTIIATGPLTNIATFLVSYPHLIGNIACISLMAGCWRFGNRSPVAEFNVWQDPEAAAMVMQSGVPIELYGLDVSHKALVLKEEFALFRQQGDEISNFVADLLDFFAKDYTTRGGLPGCPIHDACAVAGLVAPRLFTLEQCYLEVDLVGQVTRGGVAIDLRTEPRRRWPYNGRVALDVDRKGFLQLLLDSCRTLAQRKEAAQ